MGEYRIGKKNLRQKTNISMEGLSSDPFKQEVTIDQKVHSYWPLIILCRNSMTHVLFSLRHMKTTWINKGTYCKCTSWVRSIYKGIFSLHLKSLCIMNLKNVLLYSMWMKSVFVCGSIEFLQIIMQNIG